jgi:hypothetical protein
MDFETQTMFRIADKLIVALVKERGEVTEQELKRLTQYAFDAAAIYAAEKWRRIQAVEQQEHAQRWADAKKMQGRPVQA